ncbi:MAG: radical SAM protein [bacterium]|nr:radical SAM protein [bacterium]
MGEKYPTNELRAKALNLKPAPVMKGYRFSRNLLEETIAHNARYAIGKEKEPRILGLFLDSADNCNLRCPHCYSSATKEDSNAPLDERKLSAWKDALIEGKKLGVQTIIFAGQGEPLMDPAVLKMIRFASQQDVWSVLFTNNILVDDTFAAGLFELKVSVISKLGSLNPEKQDELVGVKGASKKIYRGLKSFLKAGFTREGRLGIDSTILQSTAGELANLFTLCRIDGIIPYFEFLIEEGRAATWTRTEGERLSDQEAIDLFKALRKIDEESFGYTWAITPGTHTLAHGECLRSKVMLTIRGDMSVETCVNLFMESPIGNLNDSGLRNILSADAMLKVLSTKCCTGCGVIK